MEEKPGGVTVILSHQEGLRMSLMQKKAVTSFKKKKKKKHLFIYLFNFWLHRVLVAACGLFIVAFRLQGKQSQFTRGTWDLSSTTRNQTHVPCIRRILNHWTTSEVPKLSFLVITFRPGELASLELNY